jgi:type IV pilus assembly protein PilO
VLARLGQREWALIAMALVAVVALLWYFYGIVPLRQETEGVRQEINALIPERDKGRRAQRALPELRATIANLQAERAGLPPGLAQRGAPSPGPLGDPGGGHP